MHQDQIMLTNFSSLQQTMINCVSYNCNSVRNNVSNVRNLTLEYDIILLQELMLLKDDLSFLKTINETFDCIACVEDRSCEGIIEGRPSKGVAIMWKKSFSPIISPVYCNDRIIAVVVTAGMDKYLAVNVYLPCDKQNEDSLDEYRHSLAIIENLVVEQSINKLILGGDFNADLNKGRFGQELQTFATINNLLICDSILPVDTFTYLSPGTNSVSWLDHILVPQSMKDSICDIEVRYDLAIFDHFPLAFKIKVEKIKEVIIEDEHSTQYVNWSLFKSANIVEEYKEKVNRYVNNLDRMELSCFDCHSYMCNDKKHIQELDFIYNYLVQSLICSTNEYIFEDRKRPPVHPGWNDHVAHLHQIARESFLNWKLLGCPNDGSELEAMKESRKDFKKALKHIKANKESIKNEKLAEALCNKRNSVFWKEVRKTKNNKCHLNTKIDGECDSKLIAEKFSSKFKKILSDEKCQNSLDFHHAQAKLKEDVRIGKLLGLVTKLDIMKAILELNHGIGFDGIHSNHLKYSPESISTLLAKLFTTFIVHGYLPNKMISGVIIPHVKDKLNDLSFIDNYRPIMSSSIFLKLFEYCLKFKICDYIVFNDRQHGFRENHSTQTACLILKETILSYNNSGSSVYASFVDLQKAFDKVNHFKLIDKLLKLQIPNFIVNIILYLYRNQTVRIKHKDALSDSWTVLNGVRQGGILSTILFNVYINDLIDSIASSRIGCRLGNVNSNIIAYADDIVLLVPSASGLQHLLNLLYKEVKKIDLDINYIKSECICFRADKSDLLCPAMYINGKLLDSVHDHKYLGFVLDSKLNNDKDMIKCRNKFYNEFNCILRKFPKVNIGVFLRLFTSYCLSIYGCELWFCSNKCYLPFKQFAIGYHKAVKKILGIKNWESNHKACQLADLMTFNHLMNWNKIRFAYKIIVHPFKFIEKSLLNVTDSLCLTREVDTILSQSYNVYSLMENDIEAIKSRINYVQNHEPRMR